MSDGVVVRDALLLDPLCRARVVAGAGGLERLIRHVNVMEVPDIVDWVKADQLLLTTGYPLRDDRARILDLVPRLAERGLAGLAVKPARYIDSIPAPMLDAANRLDFPLIELPIDTSFDDVINAVMNVIHSAATRRLQSSVTINNHFVRTALEGGGLPEIVRELSRLTNRETAIVGPDGEILARSSLDVDSALTDQHLDWSRLLRREQSFPLTVARPFGVLVLQPIRAGSDLHGGVVILVDGPSPSANDLVAIEHAATVAALRLVQSRAVASADRRYHAVCLEELVSGHVVDRDTWNKWAGEFGWNPSLPRAVLLAEIHPSDSASAPGGSDGNPTSQPWHAIAASMYRILGIDAIVWERQATIAALVAPGAGGNSRLKDALNQIQADARWRFPDTTVAIGVGRVYADPLCFNRSFDEALQALVVGRRLGLPGQVWLFEDLGLDRLLLSCPSTELGAFRDATIGRLRAYDATHHASLLSTLDTFLACNRNAAVTARTLYVHYNTIAHRLERIEEVIGPFVDDADRCLTLHLALRIERLLRT